MNKIYRLVWNHALNAWVAVSEISRGRGKSPSAKKCMVGAVAALLSPAVLAAPTGGQISAGSGAIAQSGLNTTINQTSQNLAINWQSFGIAANETVHFNQPNASAIALNRVLGQDPSQILGSLTANGQVFILNPNGVLFGKGAQVNVGGLAASTLSLSDADFMAGNYKFSGTGGSVVNQGTLSAAQGGYIALLAPEVRNEGVITATLGTALLAAGDKVTLNLNNGSLLGYSIDQGALNALAENKQLIQADGGQVLMSAKAADALSTAVVNNTGIVEARTIQNFNGSIKLMGDMQVGTVNVGGTLDASAPDGGNGGFIETSAAHVHVADNARVTTLAANGLAGSWLIDPVDFTIAASGGDMTGAAVSSALAGGNFSILSTSGATGTSGNINVNDAVSWSANTLTLNAQNNININAAMNASGTASLALLYGQGAVALNNTSNIITGANGVVNLPAGTTNFTTKQGSNGVVMNYTVITSLGVAGDATVAPATPTLQGMAAAANLANNYVLGANIDATATNTWGTAGCTPTTCAGFTPIGNSITNFSGTFDGLGHTITGLTIKLPTTNYVGLFGAASSTATLRNVGLVGGAVSGGNYVGGLAGANYGKISNSYATGAVSGSNYVGGLVGYGIGTISNSYATGNVSSTGSYVGGLTGNYRGTISNSYATGAVSGSSYVGGLLGANGGTISNSYSTGNVTGTGSHVGGLVGGQNATVTNSFYNLDTVTVNGAKPFSANGLYNAQFTDWKNNGLTLNPVTYFGTATAANTYTVTGVQGLKDLLGFAGSAGTGLTFKLAGNIDMSTAPAGFYLPSWTGTFDGQGHTLSNFTLANSSGIIGFFGQALTGSAIKNLGLLNVNVSGTTGNFVGALVGNNAGTLSNDYATGSVSSTSGFYVGGLAGYNTGGTISNSYATVSVSSTSGGFVGGLVGYNIGSGTINNSYTTGSVSSTSGNYVGGLVGYSSGSGTISNSYTTGSVSSTSGSYVGGLVGYNNVPIRNSYATGNVSGSAIVGGLIGFNAGYGTTSTSYAAGLVTGTNAVGGLVGSNAFAVLTANFWDTAKSGKANGLGIGINNNVLGVAGTPQAGVSGLTTTQMMAQASFTPAGTAAGQWDFTPGTGTWVIFEGQSNPLLRSLMTPLTITANNAVKTYDGLAYNGSGGVSYSVAPNMANLLGTLSYTGGGTGVGSYTITPSGLTSAPVQQGYLIGYASGTLTVNPVLKADTAPLVAGVSPAVVQAITALPDGNKLLPVFNTAIPELPPPVAMNMPSTMLDGDSLGANGKTTTIATGTSVNVQTGGSGVEQGSNVTIMNGGMHLPDNVRVSLQVEE